MQIIFHIDLNAFFANAEISIHPELKGKPLVIANNKRRSIITTASYEAREYGIHSAMPLFQALELCKDLVIRKPDFTLYRQLSNSFFELLSSYSDLLEVASIDECYLDVTSYVKNNQIDPYTLGLQIQKRVLEQLSLPCSIGIAPNKFLAKMASDMKKPLGITVLTKSNLKQVLWPLPISDMFGVGKKTQPKLIAVGIETIGDIANYDNYNKLRQVVGKQALLLYRKANGIDNSRVNSHKNELKSVGNSTTLQYDTTDEELLYQTLKELSKQVSTRANNRGLISNCIQITIKFTRFESITRQTIISKYINDYETILSTAKMLFDKHYNNRPVRLLGVSLNNVIPLKDYKEQLSLFHYQEEKEEDNISQLIEDINNKLHHSKVMKASSLNKTAIQNKYQKEK